MCGFFAAWTVVIRNQTPVMKVGSDSVQAKAGSTEQSRQRYRRHEHPVEEGSVQFRRLPSSVDTPWAAPRLNTVRIFP